jgi:hypothetical protein
VIYAFFITNFNFDEPRLHVEVSVAAAEVMVTCSFGKLFTHKLSFCIPVLIGKLLYPLFSSECLFIAHYLPFILDDLLENPSQSDD